MFDSTTFLKYLADKPGVYRMYDTSGEILYVGKAANLKKRVASYFRANGLTPKTRALVSRIENIEVTLTNSDVEALLLEQNLIKTLKPPFNILLRDDKSYPYIYLSTDKDFPSLKSLRTRKKSKSGRYFGPYPSSGAVKESLNFLQATFKVRQCDESFYSNRSRPCLQYQIGRCKAPCVGLVELAEYAQDVEQSVLFLEGKSPELIRQLIVLMTEASSRLEFEKAAELRDKINRIRHVQEHQVVESGTYNLDVIGQAVRAGEQCVSMLYVRSGRIIGQKNYFTPVGVYESDDDLLTAFIEQYYCGGHPVNGLPEEVVVERASEQLVTVFEAVRQTQQKNIKVGGSVRGDRLAWLSLSNKNALSAMDVRLRDKQSIASRYRALADMLGMGMPPQRIECFDISHSSGEFTVASCVVFGSDGPSMGDSRLYIYQPRIPGMTMPPCVKY